MLEIINNAMTALGLNYAFMEWKDEIVYPYFIGEYQETEPLNEDGMQDIDFILTGYSRSTWAALEEAKEEIRNYFNMVSGKTVIAADGAAVAIFYANSFVVPTGDAELKKIQINLRVKKWGVN